MNDKGTRALLMDAAKRVFIRNGFDDTTMIDIAAESGMSRRTLYTYFESKAEVYRAVVKDETEKLLEKLQVIKMMDIPAEEKIQKFVSGHFLFVKDMVDHNGTLRSAFFRNNWNLEHFRGEFDLREKQMLMDIVMEGIDKGVFQVENVKRSAEIIQYSMRGFEYPFIRGKIWQVANRNEIQKELQKLLWSVVGYSQTV